MNKARVQAMTQPAALDELMTLVDPGKVLTDPESLQAYGKDWTRHYPPAPSAIVLPRTIEQVQAIVRWANAHRVALVPSGGVPDCPRAPWPPTGRWSSPSIT